MSHTNDLVTPEYITKAIGPFDLDPCECVSQPWRHAVNGFCADGLYKEWEGDVWLRPPVEDDMYFWLDKLWNHGSGIALVTAKTHSETFHQRVFDGFATALFFIRGILRFYKPDGEFVDDISTESYCLIAYGDQMAKRLEYAATGKKLVGSFIRLKPEEP